MKLQLFRLDRRLREVLGARGVVLAALFVMAIASVGILSTQVKSSSSSGQTTTTSSLPGSDDFDTVAISVTSPGQEPLRHCALRAATEAQRERGLMGRDDLGGKDAMVFVFEEEVNSRFYMANVRFPLSVAFFRADGSFVSATDMEPCKTSPEQCPLYGAAGPYRYAVEVEKGGLAGLGVSTGSVLSVGSAGSCS